MKSKISKYHITLSLICSLLIVCLIAYISFNRYRALYFVVDMEASTSGTVQIFYATAGNYTETDSARLPVSPGGFHTYSIPLASSKFRSLRFDPITTTAVISIKRPRIENGGGLILKEFPLRSFKPVRHIDTMEFKNDTLTIRTADNEIDPILIIENSSLNANVGWDNFIKTQGWSYAAYVLLLFIIFIVLAKFCWPTSAKSVSDNSK